MRKSLFAVLCVAALLWSVPRFFLPRLRVWQPRQQPVAWKNIAPGVQMRTFQTLQGAVVALRTRPSHVHVFSGRPGERLDAAGWRRRADALAAVNGGFFDERDRVIGLRIANGKKLAPLHPADWGVFSIRANRATISHTRDFIMKPGIREAVQCGPRLVVGGRVLKLKEQWARRTAIGVERGGAVVIAIADDAWSLPDWARFWAAKSGLNCPNALGLDGGPSTQISVRTPKTKLEIAGYGLVADAVVVR